MVVKVIDATVILVEIKDGLKELVHTRTICTANPKTSMETKDLLV